MACPGAALSSASRTAVIQSHQGVRPIPPECIALRMAINSWLQSWSATPPVFPSANFTTCQFLSPLIYVAVKHILLVIMKKPSLGLLLTASDGIDKDKCYIMLPWHRSVWIVKGHPGENETANILAVFREQQTDRLWRWRSVVYVAPSNNGILDRNTFSSSQTHGFKKTVPKLQQFPLGPTLTAQEPRTMSNLCERATSTENKRLIAVMANCDTPPM